MSDSFFIFYFIFFFTFPFPFRFCAENLPPTPPILIYLVLSLLPPQTSNQHRCVARTYCNACSIECPAILATRIPDTGVGCSLHLATLYII